MFTATYCARRDAILEPSTPALSPEPSGAAPSKEINRLLCAAVISRSFRDRLLHDPSRALEEGCNQEHFRLTNPERDRVLNHSASTLAEFAAGLRSALSPRPEPERSAAPSIRVAGVMPPFAADRTAPRVGYAT